MKTNESKARQRHKQNDRQKLINVLCESEGAQDGEADRNLIFSASTPNNSELAAIFICQSSSLTLVTAPLTSCPLSNQYIFWLSLKNLNLNKRQPD